MRSFAVALALGALPACAGDLESEGSLETHPLLTEGRCGSCRIVAETLAVMGDDADTVAIIEGGVPVLDSRGRFYLIEKSRSRVLVFTPDGRYQQAFGVAGLGPGEFRGITDVHVAPGDTLIVLTYRSIHVVGPDYVPVRQMARAAQSGDPGFFNTMLRDGRILRLTGENQFDILSRDGTVQGPVRLASPDTLRCTQCGLRAYREGVEQGTIWSGTQNRYRVEQHDLSGKFLQGFTRRVHWFPTWRSDPAENIQAVLEELAKPRLLGVRQTPDGLLWTHIALVDDPDRVPRLPEPNTVNERAATRLMSSVLANYVTMIEVIDPRTREVLASRELKMIASPMLGDLVSRISVDEHGDWSCVVMRLRLEGR
jgi:hypothetical protein